MELSIWKQCLKQLQEQLSQEEFNQWISPLQAEETPEGVILFAPNEYVLGTVQREYHEKIESMLASFSRNEFTRISIVKGSKAENRPLPGSGSAAGSGAGSESGLRSESGSESRSEAGSGARSEAETTQSASQPQGLFVRSGSVSALVNHQSNLNPAFSFDSFVEGKSNQLAKAAASQVAENPGAAYNPLFLYGGVGLGKTHLTHAVGNFILKKRPNARIVYLHSERFVGDMVKALQSNAINEFKRYYRTVDALLIDDIQFFAGKERSQEEFFHTFNALLEGQQQIIITSDRYPKEINGIEERLKSRFGSGLTVAVQPPDLETRVAILMNKALALNVELPYEIAFFIAKKIRSNVRELEGALKRVVANAQFTGSLITLDFVREALSDLLALQEKLVSIDNIIKTVAEYHKLKSSDMFSKRRNRSVARPRQVAMALCKELTNHSLPEIGEAFGGRDHTTVLHACRQIKSLREQGGELAEDYINLLRILSS